ncbi:MAG: hypothetical protein NTX65_00550 [Ignavibacteriales bacterium]|nr:hypothetical protein [Ignavibacteriales bacterium]
MNKKTQIAFNKLLSDKTSGSVDLLLKLNTFCKKYLFDVKHPLEFIQQAQIQFSSFQNIQRYLAELKSNVHSKQVIMEFFTATESKAETSYWEIYTSAMPFLQNKKSILTISNSRTVLETIRNLAKTNYLIVTICESRPKFEGRILAKKLLSSKIKVEIITEAMAPSYVRKCDCILVGADTVLKDGSIINKVGTLQLALSGKYFKKPFYVVAEKSKFKRSLKITQRKELSNEIWNNSPKGIVLNNFYFEKIPGSLITKIFSEQKKPDL